MKMHPSRFLVAAALTASSVIAIGFAYAQSTPSDPAAAGQTTGAPAQAAPADSGMQTPAQPDSANSASSKPMDSGTSGGGSAAAVPERPAKPDRN